MPGPSRPGRPRDSESESAPPGGGGAGATVLGGTIQVGNFASARTGPGHKWQTEILAFFANGNYAHWHHMMTRKVHGGPAVAASSPAPRSLSNGCRYKLHDQQPLKKKWDHSGWNTLSQLQNNLYYSTFYVVR